MKPPDTTAVAFARVIPLAFVLTGCAQAHHSTPELLSELQHGSVEERVGAASVLSQRPDAISDALSTAALTDPDLAVRYWAMASLVSRGESGRQTFERASKDPNPCIQRVARCALLYLDHRPEADGAACKAELDRECEGVRAAKRGHTP